MDFTILVVGMFASLVGFLVWCEAPRRRLIEILEFSVAIYGLSFFIGVHFINKLNPALVDGFTPYLLPVPLVASFVAWSMRSSKRARPKLTHSATIGASHETSA